MDKINNFKALEIENLKQFREPNPLISNNISKTMGQFQFIGQMVDLFFTKFLGSSLGGINLDTPAKRNNNYPNSAE